MKLLLLCGVPILATLFLSAPQLCQPALVVTLNELGESPVVITTEPNMTRPIRLVTNHTYHLTCRDTSPHGRFDIFTNNIWWREGVPVTKLSLGTFPPADEPAEFSSISIYNEISNEWTLVIQKLGVANKGLGEFSCRGLSDEIVSFNISQTSHTVLAGEPVKSLVVGRSPSSSVVTLTPFVSPHLNSADLQWLFNGRPAASAFPEGVSEVESEVIFSRTISLAMSGNYTCVASFEGGLTERSASFIVTVNVPPQPTLSPDGLVNGLAFNDSRFILQCTDRTGIPLSHSIIWKLNGTPLLVDGLRVNVSTLRTADSMTSFLVIEPLLPRDIGTFTCQAVSTVGVAMTSFSLTQLLVASTISYDTVYSEGSMISLQVHISTSSSATPAFNYTWKRDDRTIPQTFKYSIKQNSLPGGASIITLEVSDARSTDSGVYSCELSNILSSAVVIFDYVGVATLAVSSSVYISTHLTLMVGSTASLRCEATFTNVPSWYVDLDVTVSWRRPDDLSLGQNVILSNSTEIISIETSRRTYGKSLTFKPVMKGDGGRYLCLVMYRLSARSEVKQYSHESSIDIDSVFFQLRLTGIRSSCEDWTSTDMEVKLASVMNATLSNINRLCSLCTLTPSHVTSAGFHCFPESPQAVVFRAKLHSTRSTSSADLLPYLSAWITQEGAAAMANLEVSLDSSCPVEISSLDAEDCSHDTSTESVDMAAGVPAVVVISVSVVVGCVLVVLVTIVVSMVIWTVCRSRHASDFKDAKKPSSDTSVRATNPYIPPPLPGEGPAEPEYEDLDKFAVPDAGYNTVPDSYISMKSVKVPEDVGHQHNHLTYDYAAV